jgi:3-carboxy-cis,cis-muconate cycloisomerase
VKSNDDVNGSSQPFLPLVALFGDPSTARCFTEEAMVESWLEVERELACVQAELGIIPVEASERIRAEATIEKINVRRLNEETRTVGYPILPLLDEINAQSSPEVSAYIHWGTTTQDIMDTGLALQMARALDRVEELTIRLGSAIARSAEMYRDVPMAGRTHAQQAVPTTLGAKMAVWLGEVERHLDRIRALRPRLLVVQLYGAGGTAAALGDASRETRHRLAARLGLYSSDVPWHTARDSIAEIAFVLAAAAGTCGKLAKEVINLSRSEIAEVREEVGWHRGASSTMPQKTNPIASEVVVGMSALVRQLVPALLDAMQAGHERSAGEWQIEWDSVPLAFSLAAGCLTNTCEIVEGLQVFPNRMRANLSIDGGMIMSEAVMMALARIIGRAEAHDLIYAACALARSRDVSLADSLQQSLDESLLQQLPPMRDLLNPDNYLGEAQAIVSSAVGHWAEVLSVRSTS